jgi:hypothetical protein
MALQSKFGSKFGAAVPAAKKKKGEGVRRELANFFAGTGTSAGSAAADAAKAPATGKAK